MAPTRNTFFLASFFYSFSFSQSLLGIVSGRVGSGGSDAGDARGRAARREIGGTGTEFQGELFDLGLVLLKLLLEDLRLLGRSEDLLLEALLALLIIPIRLFGIDALEHMRRRREQLLLLGEQRRRFFNLFLCRTQRIEMARHVDRTALRVAKGVVHRRDARRLEPGTARRRRRRGGRR